MVTRTKKTHTEWCVSLLPLQNAVPASVRTLPYSDPGGLLCHKHGQPHRPQQILREGCILLHQATQPVEHFVSPIAVPPVDEPVALPPQTEKKMVVLTIPEPLSARKELTSNVEEHWIQMIHDAIAQESKTGLPYFEKAFVLIWIQTPRGTNNKRVWDTSNRAINVVINNLKGIFFDDDDFEHMACGVVADWGEIGQTEIRICALQELEKYEIFR